MNKMDANTLKCPYKDVPIPTNTSLPDYILNRALQHGNKTALVDVETGRSCTFNEFVQQVKHLSDALWDIGLRHGDRILSCCKNNIDFPVLFFAVTKLGAVVSPCNPLFTPGEMLVQVEDSGATFIFGDPSTINTIRNTLSKCRQKMKAVIVRGNAASQHGEISYEALMQQTHPPAPKVHVNGGDICTTLYSSGTTGKPKGVLVTHQAKVANLVQAEHPNFRLVEENAVLIVFLPMYHIAGLLITNLALAYGCKVLVMPAFDFEKFLDLIQTHKVTNIGVVPPVMVLLAKHPATAKFDLSSMETLLVGAAPVSSNLSMEVQKKFGLKQIKQMFGMTEVGLAIGSPNTSWKHGSSGQLLPNMQAKIVDVSTGQTLGPHKSGELWIRGPQSMVGYHNRPDATAETIDKDGFLHTGDIAHYDEDGFFYVTDRLKELIKYKAFQVAPAELEDLLLKHPAVADAAVIGVPDEAAGELPRAYIVIKPGAKTSQQDIQAFVAEHAAPHKKLRGGVEFVDSLPKSPSGKIIRRMLKDQLKKQLASNL